MAKSPLVSSPVLLCYIKGLHAVGDFHLLCCLNINVFWTEQMFMKEFKDIHAPPHFTVAVLFSSRSVSSKGCLFLKFFRVREMLPCQLCAAVSFFEDTTNSRQLAFSFTAIISDPKRLLPSSLCFTEHKLRDVLLLCHNEDRC